MEEEDAEEEEEEEEEVYGYTTSKQSDDTKITRMMSRRMLTGTRYSTSQMYRASPAPRRTRGTGIPERTPPQTQSGSP